MFTGYLAAGQTGDLGAQIAAADAALGASPGQITVSTSGTISEGQVSLSVGHSLVCTGQTTISLNAGSYLYQNSHTSIKNCIISATPTPINGEIQSSDTHDLELDAVTFVGGGNLVYWNGVSGFRISDNKVVSITASDPATQVAQSGYDLTNCAWGRVDNLTVSSFVFPAGPASYPGILDLNLSHDITINNTSINYVDASFDFGGSGIQINGSSRIAINGGVITHNAKMDGVTSESMGTSPSSDIAIIGLDASYNGGQGLNTAAPLTLGDGIDIINTDHVRISNCTILGSGYAGNKQPGIWLFLDDDVEVLNCDVSNGSTSGIAVAGSLNVHLTNNTIRENQESGTFTEAQIGTGTSAGSTVTWVTGSSGGFAVAWPSGTPFIFDGITYAVASVTDNLHIVLTPPPPSHPSPAAWEVDSINEEILGGLIEDNGIGLTGGQTQVGIDWADATNGAISGVTATNTGIGDQLYGLELDNLATATLSNDNFLGNLKGGNGIYASSQTSSPSTILFSTQGVGTASMPQTVTLIAGAVVVQNLLIQVSGNFSETNNCGAGLPAFGRCQVSVTFKPANAGTSNGALTLTDSAPNSPQTVSLTGTGVAQGLGLSIATGGSGSATVVAGATAKYSLSIGGGGMSGAVVLSCSGAPKGATCNIPATETISPTQGMPFAVSVTTLAHTTDSLRPTNFRPSHWLWALAMMASIVFPRVRTKRSARRHLFWPPLLLLMYLCSCGGNITKTSLGTPAGSYTLTVTATVGSTSEQLPLTLTVQ
jgi:parallel beta-helix repeat protein